MHTILLSKSIKIKLKGKFSEEQVEQIIERIHLNPTIGKRLEGVSNVYKYELGLGLTGKSEYTLYYFYKGKSKPILLINIFKKDEKEILSKLIEVLISDTL